MSPTALSNSDPKRELPKRAYPSFEKPLHVGYPNIADKQSFFERVEQAFERNWLTNDGPLVQEFEQRIAEFVRAKHCIAMCNGTIALEIAIRAVGISGEVILPSYTFVATAHAFQWQGIKPVFCDIDQATHNIDPQRVEDLVTDQTSAILGVHLWGRPCDIEDLTEIADRRGLHLLFDAAHAFGCSFQGEMLGSFGACEVFSFHATKFLHSCEGGAVVTNDDELANRMRLMRNFGFQGTDRVSYLGTNGKMSELSAAMGLTSMDQVELYVTKNQRNYHAYGNAIRQVPGVRLLEYDSGEKNNFQYVVLEVDPVESGLTRDQFVQVLHSHNVLARRYFYPGVHGMEPYRSLYPHASQHLPHTESVMNRVIVMPTGYSMSLEAVARIGEILAWACKNSVELQAFLPQTISPGESFAIDAL